MTSRPSTGVGDQLAFDIDELIREARLKNTPAWTGAPLHFTTEYHPPADLVAALEHARLVYGGPGPRPRLHMWRRSICAPAGVELGGHRIDVFDADLRCDRASHPSGDEACSCVGDLIYLAICEPCAWQVIDADENTVVEAWHDHALPGWRELPVVPSNVNRRDHNGYSKSTRAWIAKHYPTAAQAPGAPIITARQAHGTRHVSGRSPWGGYDLSDSAVTSPPARIETRGLGD